MATYLPRRESDLVTWSKNFETLVTADAAAYGLSLDQSTAYLNAQAAFAAAYQVANESTTRSPANIEIKNTAKKALIELTREYVNICQAYPGMTNDKRAALQITIPDTDRTPVPVPETAPDIDLVSVIGNTVTIRLHNADSTKRARPAYVTGATVFTHVGSEPPADIAGWKFEGNTKLTTVDINVPPTVAPNSKLWITAFWRNNLDQSGPATSPVFTWTGNGGVSMAA